MASRPSIGPEARCKCDTGLLDSADRYGPRHPSTSRDLVIVSITSMHPSSTMNDVSSHRHVQLFPKAQPIEHITIRSSFWSIPVRLSVVPFAFGSNVVSVPNVVSMPAAHLFELFLGSRPSPPPILLHRQFSLLPPNQLSLSGSMIVICWNLQACPSPRPSLSAATNSIRMAAAVDSYGPTGCRCAYSAAAADSLIPTAMLRGWDHRPSG
ncbi:hypothetical protein C8J56DRAFT_1077822 [Mycena floridula]|nr:hypothetical protein C8J56DRAFT_1077822 [Mycena floridula]